MFLIKLSNGDDVDYEFVIREKFPKCEVEVLTPEIFDIEKLVEYITDDIIILKPYAIFCYRHLIRFLMKDNIGGKIYYLDNFADEELRLVHAGLLKCTWERDVKINLFKNADPDRDVLGLK